MGLEEIRKLKEQAKLPKQKKSYKIPKVSAKKKEQQKEEAKVIKISGGNEMDRWFQDRRKEMNGVCLHCGGLSCKDSTEYYKFSIAHILPKRLFRSIATHPLNWIELCFWNNSCHTNFDQCILDFTELNCFDLVVERFIAMYPSINPKERRFIPDVLLQYVKNETDI